MFFCSSKRRKLELVMVIVFFLCFRVEAKCSSGCDLAMASYFLVEGSNLTYISDIFGKNIPKKLAYNPDVKNQNTIQFGTRVNIPFSCDCLNDDFFGHTFDYTTQPGDTYKIIAQNIFANLTTADWIQRINHLNPNLVLLPYTSINVTVNCSCGDETVSKDYGLFMTYPLHPEDNLSFVASESGVPKKLLQMYNPGMDFSQGSGLVFIPAKGCL
ncbi:hypothetical protein MKX03_009750 [Papaver bracteatum]|nr:hypothetical protein MKX03_009750 [Papaver bracteatum]